jgi:anti-sigma B factor antagonist
MPPEEITMSQRPPQPFFLEKLGEITIVRFTDPKIGLDAREALYGLVENQGDQKIVLNFENVRFLSSAAIGMLINLKNKAEAGGGTLKLCQLDPDIREILRLTTVDRLFSIFDTEQDAIGSFRSA